MSEARGRRAEPFGETLRRRLCEPENARRFLVRQELELDLANDRKILHASSMHRQLWSILLIGGGGGLGCGGQAGNAQAGNSQEMPAEVREFSPPASVSGENTPPGMARPPRSGASTGQPSTGPMSSAPVESFQGTVTEPQTSAGELVLETFCGSCHSPSAIGDGNGGFADMTDIDSLVRLGWLVPLRSSESLLVDVMLDGSMPPPGIEPRPTRADIMTVIHLIDNPLYWPDPPPSLAPEPEVAADAGSDAG